MNYQPTRRNVLHLSAAMAASALALTGCGSSPAAESSGPATLRFTWWGGDARQKATQKVIDAFNAENPNITVVGEYGDWNGYWDKLATQVAANDAPDIIQMDEKYVREYGDRGALLDLKELELDTSGIDGDALKNGEVNGRLVGLVTGLATFCIAANPAVLEKAGVAMPDETTWSWDDYREIGKKISESGTGATGVGIGWDDADLYIWARQNGDRLYDDSGNVVIRPETLASFWQNAKELSTSGAGPTPSAAVENASASLNQKAIAQNGMGFAGIFNTQLTAYSAASGQQLKLLRLPGESQAEEPAAYYKASMFWSISSRTRHRKAAEKFLNYLTNSEAAGNEMLTERGIPANATIRAAIAPKLGATDKAAIDFIDAVADHVSPAPPITPAGGSTISELLSRYTSDVLFDRTTPEKAAQPFIDELSSSLRK